MRKIIVSGFLSADAKKQFSKQNREFVTFTISNNEYNDPKDSSGRHETHWFRVSCFNSNHLNMVQHLKKNKPIIVSGTLNDSIYMNKDGKPMISRDIIADSIDFLPNGRNNDTQQSNNSQSVVSNNNVMPQVTWGNQPSTPPQVPSLPQVPSPQQATTNVEDDLPF